MLSILVVSENEGKGFKNHLSSLKPLPDGASRRGEGAGCNSIVHL